MDPFHSVRIQDAPVKLDLGFKSEVLAVVPDTNTHPGPRAVLTLMDLPNEILLAVCECLDDELFTLSQISRRLHYLALPVYFARKGMNPFTGELVLFNDWSMDVLRGLSIALFKPAMNSVYYSFDSHRPYTELSRARGAIEALGSVKELHLDAINIQISSPLTKVIHKGFQELIETALDKSCETLTVCVKGWELPYPPNLERVLHKVNRPNISLPSFFSEPRHTGLQDLVTASVKCMKRQMAALGLLGSAKRAPKLQVLNLHSPMLFQEGIFLWTIGLLNSSQIRALSLRDIGSTSRFWGVTLPAITMPSLRDLSVEACPIADDDLFDFLLRHPKITHLRLGRYLRCTQLQSPPSGLLPSLSHLAATPGHVCALLKYRSVLRSLKSVCLVVRNSMGDELDLVKLGNTLLLVRRRLRKVDISLEVSCEYPNAAWALNISERLETGDIVTDALRQNPLLHLSSIHLRLAFYSTPEGLTNTWPKWFSLFPKLASVQFTTISRDGPTDPARRFHFITSIFATCPSVQRVEINGVNHERNSA